MTEKIGSLSYRLKLPDYLRSVHPVFHISQLEPYTPSTIPNRTQTPPPPVVIDEQEEYEVTEVLDLKVDRRCKACLLLYYIRWKGYEGTPDKFSWVLATELHANDLVPAFHVRCGSTTCPAGSLHCSSHI